MSGGSRIHKASVILLVSSLKFFTPQQWFASISQNSRSNAAGKLTHCYCAAGSLTLTTTSAGSAIDAFHTMTSTFPIAAASNCLSSSTSIGSNGKTVAVTTSVGKGSLNPDTSTGTAAAGPATAVASIPVVKAPPVSLPVQAQSGPSSTFTQPNGSNRSSIAVGSAELESGSSIRPDAITAATSAAFRPLPQGWHELRSALLMMTTASLVLVLAAQMQ